MDKELSLEMKTLKKTKLQPIKPLKLTYRSDIYLVNNEIFFVIDEIDCDFPPSNFPHTVILKSDFNKIKKLVSMCNFCLQDYDRIFSYIKEWTGISDKIVKSVLLILNIKK
jgi:hypothetical protein